MMSPIRPAFVAVASALLSMLAVLGLAGCGGSDGGGDSAVRINNPQQILIEDDYDYQTRTDTYDWNTNATVARMEIRGHDFHHGSFRVRALDAIGNEVLDVLYWSWDDFWYIGDNEFYDLRYTELGVAGRWTIILEFDEFDSYLEVDIQDNLDPPDPDDDDPPDPNSPILDDDFGNDGVTRSTGENGTGVDVAVDSQGRIVTSGLLVDSLGNRRLAVWRLLSNGNLDPSFGTGGVYQLFQDDESVGTRLAIASGDAILVTGIVDDGAGASDILVTKITAAGVLDSAFGPGGTVAIDDGRTERGADIAVDGDGKIYVAGTTRTADGSDRKILLARLLPAGILDPTFGTDGVLRTAGPSDSCRGLVLDSLERPTVLGQRGNGILIFRTNIIGEIDLTFGSLGYVVRAPSPGITWNPIGFARRSTDGYFGIAGIESVEGYNAPDPKLAVWLYTVGGEAVTNFSADGFITQEYSGGSAAGTAIGFDSSGRLLVAGATGPEGGDTAATFWRINVNGTLDTTLPNRGVVRFDDPAGADRTAALGLTVQPSGAVFVTGAFRSSGGRFYMSTYKLQP